MSAPNFVNEAFEKDYEGDHPWYHILWVNPPTPKERKKIENLFFELPWLLANWENEGKYYEVACELDRAELQKWNTSFQPKFRALIEKIHSQYPIATVGFQGFDED